MAKTVFSCAFCAFTFGLLAATPAGAEVRVWDDGAADSYWHSPNNWDPNGYLISDHLIVTSGSPTANADVTTWGSITLDGPTSIAIFGTRTVNIVTRMNIVNGAYLTNNYGNIGTDIIHNGIVSVSGAGSTWNNGATLTIGESSVGTLNISDGGLVQCSSGYLGDNDWALGNVMVSGGGSRWELLSLYVGEEGQGELTINDGGVVATGSSTIANHADSSGNVTVSGAGSTWFHFNDMRVGDEGSATVSINNGGAVSSRDSYIGNVTGSQGEVTVSGDGSNWAMSRNLYVGNHGTGTMAITNGGSVTNEEGYVAYEIGSTGNVTVSGAGSTWTNTYDLEVGRNGGGTLLIVNAGTVSNRHCDIGYNAGSTGDVTVSGSGSIWANSDRLSVGQGGAGTMTITDDGSVSSLYCRIADYSGSQGDVTVRGAGSTWTNTGSLYVGDAGTGTLTISDGGSVSNGDTAVIGWAIAASGNVTVSGTGSTWVNSGDLDVGSAGTGTMMIADGGAVSNANAYIGDGSSSVGDVTVQGAGSTWTNNGNLVVGDQGTGTLTIRDGGSVSATGSLIIADDGASTGTVHLEAGSLTADSIAANLGTADFNWSGGTLAITGATGLTISSGGILGDTVIIGPDKGLDISETTTVESGVTLSVNGGSFSTNKLTVGTGGRAQLRTGTIHFGDSFAVNAGGELEIAEQDLVVITAPVLEGKLSLDQTTISVPSMTVASGATLNLDSGMIVASGAFTNQELIRMGTVGPAIIRAGTLNNNGALLGQGSVQAAVVNTGNIAISGDSNFTEDVFNISGGKIIASGGSAVTFFEDVNNETFSEIRVSEDCSVTYFGDVMGTGDFNGTGTSYIEGDMRPGASPGTMAFEGDVVFGSLAGLQIEVGGTTPGDEFDRLEIAGRAILDGTLDVRLFDLGGGMFAPSAGDSFEIITVDSGITNMFGTELLPALTGDLTWNVRYTTTSVFLEILAAFLEADFDEDGDVDGDDFLAWQGGFGTPTGAEHGDGDADADGDVDGNDFLVWQAQFGSAAGTAATTAVPEPNALGLLCLAGVAAFGWRRM